MSKLITFVLDEIEFIDDEDREEFRAQLTTKARDASASVRAAERKRAAEALDEREYRIAAQVVRELGYSE